jgi:hypothetical protein
VPWQEGLLMVRPSTAEEDLVVAVWANPNKQKGRPNARTLETLTSEASTHPIAMPLASLKAIQSWKSCPVATTTIEIDFLLTPEISNRENPILIPISLAKSYLGWQEFYVSPKYMENK